MSRSVNKVILIGNVGRDPDIQTTASGAKVAHLSLATSRRIPRGSGFEQRTEWHRLTLWDRLAGIAADYVRKATASTSRAASSTTRSSGTASPSRRRRSSSRS